MWLWNGQYMRKIKFYAANSIASKQTKRSQQNWKDKLYNYSGKYQYTSLEQTVRINQPKGNQWGHSIFEKHELLWSLYYERLELIDFDKTLHLITAKYTFFLSTYSTFTNITISWGIKQSE